MNRVNSDQTDHTVDVIWVSTVPAIQLIYTEQQKKREKLSF